MTKRRISIFALLLALLMTFSLVLTACNPKDNPDDPKKPDDNPDDKPAAAQEYTYRSYTEGLGNNWNPHTWEMNADDAILEQTTIPLVDVIMVKDGEYGWHYEMATAIEDVTASASAADKTKWGIEDGEEGRMWKISLNQNAKFENGDAIKADDYVESMKRMLDPQLQNYRANSYVADDFEIVGARRYYYQGQRAYYAATTPYTSYSEDLDGSLYFHIGPLVKDAKDYTGAYSKFRSDYGSGAYKAYGVTAEQTAGDFLVTAATILFGVSAPITAEEANALEGKTFTEIKADATLKASYDALFTWWSEDDEGDTDPDDNLVFFVADYTWPTVSYDIVGLYKVDDYTIMYVGASEISEFDFFVSCASASWLVHTATYDKAITEEAGVKVCKYGTSKDNYVGYGPYVIGSYEKDKQIVYVQNENWYGWEKQENGALLSYITLDGKKVQQYQTTKIIVDVMTYSAALQAFLKGDLDDISLKSDDAVTYAASQRLSKVDETYTLRFFFNTGATSTLDAAADGLNQNSAVLKNDKFRKAFSLAINRTEFCNTATAGFKPAYALMNTLYYYDVANDPTSIYRTSEWGMKAVVELYGIEYGADKTYKTLEEAYNAVTGYDVTEAKKLMKEACDELVADGSYTAGEEIKIQVAYSKAAIDSQAQAQEKLINQYLNAAIEGSGFGKITLTYIGGLEDRYDDTIKGKYAIGSGAWGGGAFYPFRNFRVYMDTTYADVHEQGSYDPSTETLTIEEFKYKDSKGATQTFAGKTLTWQVWSQALAGGKLDGANMDLYLKLELLYRIEKAFVSNYWCVVLAGYTEVSLLGYKVENATQTYNIMYGFGGLRLMKYNYSDSEWPGFVSQYAVNNQLSY